MNYTPIALGLLCLALPGQALAEKISRIDIQGLDEVMTQNVRIALSLEHALERSVTTRRLEYLLEVAEDEAREALEPFGYYSAKVDIRKSGADDALVIVLNIDKGEPVRVRRENLRIEGEAADDRYMKQELAAFSPKAGEILDHTLYEAGKVRIT